jgi:ribosomal protein L29
MSFEATEVLELRDLDKDELWSRLDEVRRELVNLRFQQATGQLDDHSKLGQARRRVARVLTLIRESELEEDGYLVRRTVSLQSRPQAQQVRQQAARREASAPIGGVQDATGEDGTGEPDSEAGGIGEAGTGPVGSVQDTGETDGVSAGETDGAGSTTDDDTSHYEDAGSVSVDDEEGN